MYAVGLFRGRIRFFGASVSVNFSNEAVSVEDRSEEEAVMWKKCKAVLEAEGCITRAEVGAGDDTSKSNKRLLKLRNKKRTKNISSS
jgi:hypothetical protein